VPLPSSPERRARAAAAFAVVEPAFRLRVVAALGEVEAEGTLARLEHVLLDVFEPLEHLYAARVDPVALLADLLGVVADALERRPRPLRVLDRRREVDPGWFQRSRMIGYVAYVDRFAGTLDGVRRRLGYLEELGVTYLHLMPLLRARPGDSDGGYAVADYREVEPRLGTMNDLAALAEDLHERRISLCIDLVLNHTAAEHEWAMKARAGDPAYRDRYLVFPDRTLPDEYQRTLPDVFPDTSPGSFTSVPGLGEVWTSFNDFQWDLNWSNPDVFREMLDTILFLANRGVDVFRLDAVPFMWKRMGTNCQNQPEVHLLVQALRGLVRVAAPGVIFKAEAIVGPEQLVQYLGAHDRYRPECDLAYHNQLMVQLWSALAARDARLATHALRRLRPAPAPTSWVTYLRGHDDIGWAISDADAAAVGVGGATHRRFLIDFYAGRHPGSFARGSDFQPNPDSGDARTSGMAAALSGITAALETGDEAALDPAVRRLVTLYAVVYSFGGIPLVYMGDEIGLSNDPNWAADPAHAADNRWMHRPPMDWRAAERRDDPATVAGRVFAAFRDLGAARRAQLALRAGGQTELVDTGNPRVLGYYRRHPRSGTVLVLANFSDDAEEVPAHLVHSLFGARVTASSAGNGGLTGPSIRLDAWGFRWIAES
jgi:amylosucrase